MAAKIYELATKVEAGKLSTSCFVGPIGSETMYPSVKKVVPGDNYILTVFFDNGEDGVLDMKPILDFGIFQRIKDYDSFRRVRVAFDTIEWDCGVDLDPEYVYSRCKTSKTA